MLYIIWTTEKGYTRAFNISNHTRYKQLKDHLQELNPPDNAHIIEAESREQAEAMFDSYYEIG